MLTLVSALGFNITTYSEGRSGASNQAANFAKEKLTEAWGSNFKDLSNTSYSPSDGQTPERLKIENPKTGQTLRLYRTTTKKEGKGIERTLYAFSDNGQQIGQLTWFDVGNLAGSEAGKNDPMFLAIRNAFFDRIQASKREVGQQIA